MTQQPQHGDRVRITFDATWWQGRSGTRAARTTRRGDEDWLTLVPDNAQVQVLKPRATTTDRLTAETITSDELDALYDRIATLESVAAGNKRHVQLIVPELERAEAALVRVHHVAALIHAGAPWTANHHETAARIRAAIAAPAPAEATEPVESPLRDQIADAIGRTNLPMWHKAARYQAADAALSVVLPHGKSLGDQLRAAEAALARVRRAAEQWRTRANENPATAQVWTTVANSVLTLTSTELRTDQPKEQ